jgi:hypothetical protein
MGILGFLAGMVILVIIRGLQGLEPLMDPQLAIVLGTLLSAGFFVYGMGAFDPRMNEHAHEPAEGEDTHALVAAEEPEVEQPSQLLGGYLWHISSILLALLIFIVFFALLPQGPALRTVQQAEGNVSAVGYVSLDLGGQVMQVSQLTLLVGLVIVMFLTVAVVAGGLGFVFFGLNQGVATVRKVQYTAIEAEPLEREPATGSGLVLWAVIAGAAVVGFLALDLIIGQPLSEDFGTLSFFLAAGAVFTLSFILAGIVIRAVAGRTAWPWLVRALVILVALGLILGVLDFVLIWGLLKDLALPVVVVFNALALGVLVFSRSFVSVAFAVLTGILIPLFHFVLIGLVVPFDPPLLFGISASNALPIVALILRPKFVTYWVGYGAAWAAKQLRRLPNALQ